MNTDLVAKLLSKCASNQMVYTPMIDLEKFVKLLLDECINQCFTTDEDRIRKQFRYFDE